MDDIALELTDFVGQLPVEKRYEVLDAFSTLQKHPLKRGQLDDENVAALMTLVTNAFAGGGLTTLWEAMTETDTLVDFPPNELLDICYGRPEFDKMVRAAGRATAPKPSVTTA